MIKFCFITMISCCIAATVLHPASIRANKYFEGANATFVRTLTGGNIKAAEAALRGGADVNAVGLEGMTPLIACVVNRSRVGVVYLLAHGADFGARLSDGNSALSLTIVNGDAEFLELLLENKGDPNEVNSLRTYPLLSTAVESGNLEAIRLLLRYGAKPNLVDRNGTTPLELAVRVNSYEIAYELLRSGTDYNIKNKWNKTAIDAIKDYRGDPKSRNHQWRLKCLAFLKERGLEIDPTPAIVNESW